MNDVFVVAKGGDNKVVKPLPSFELITEFHPMVEAALKSNQIDYCQEVEGGTQMFGNANAIASALSNLVLERECKLHSKESSRLMCSLNP